MIEWRKKHKIFELSRSGYCSFYEKSDTFGAILLMPISNYSSPLQGVQQLMEENTFISANSKFSR
jgi:hypothetical protein